METEVGGLLLGFSLREAADETREREMDGPDFDKIANEAAEWLDQKNAYLGTKYDLDGAATWTFDLEPATLTFFDPDGRAFAVFDVVEIATFLWDASTWKWGWANDSVPPEMRARSAPLKELHPITGSDLFIQDDPVRIPLACRWQLTALSVRHLSAAGSFRAPLRDGRLELYLAITGVKSATRAKLLWG